MAENKNRRASVQLNVRLEPAEAALIKRVIPKGSLRGADQVSPKAAVG